MAANQKNIPSHLMFCLKLRTIWNICRLVWSLLRIRWWCTEMTQRSITSCTIQTESRWFLTLIGPRHHYAQSRSMITSLLWARNVWCACAILQLLRTTLLSTTEAIAMGPAEQMALRSVTHIVCRLFLTHKVQIFPYVLRTNATLPSFGPIATRNVLSHASIANTHSGAFPTAKLIRIPRAPDANSRTTMQRCNGVELFKTYTLQTPPAPRFPWNRRKRPPRR